MSTATQPSARRSPAPRSSRCVESDSIAAVTSPLKSSVYIDSASRDFRFAAAVSCFGQVLRQSRYAESCTLADARELAAGALGDDLYGKRKEFVQLVDKAQAVKGARPVG